MMSVGPVTKLCKASFTCPMFLSNNHSNCGEVNRVWQHGLLLLYHN